MSNYFLFVQFGNYAEFYDNWMNFFFDIREFKNTMNGRMPPSLGRGAIKGVKMSINSEVVGRIASLDLSQTELRTWMQGFPNFKTYFRRIGMKYGPGMNWPKIPEFVLGNTEFLKTCYENPFFSASQNLAIIYGEWRGEGWGTLM